MAKKKTSAKARKKQATPARAPQRLQADRPLINRILFALAFVGVLIVTHLAIGEKRGFDQGCLFVPDAEASAFDCGVVTSSAASTFLGVSNVVWGMAFYLFVAAVSFAVAFAAKERRRLLRQVRAGAITVGFLFSAYLMYYQFAYLEARCLLCMLSAGTTTLLFGVQMTELFTSPSRTSASMSTKPSRSLSFYGGVAALAVLLAGADIIYMQSVPVEAQAAVATAPATAPATAAPSDAPAPAPSPIRPAADECAYSAEIPPVEDYASLLSFRDPLKGNPDADVTVIEFYDPNCGHCKSQHAILEQVAAQYGDQAKFAYVPFILWADPTHPSYSLRQGEALYAAAQQGKYYEMLDVMFERQHGAMSLEELQAIAREVGMDVDKMTEQIEERTFMRPIMQRRQEIASLGVRSTPTIMVNGRFVANRSPACLARFIEDAAGDPPAEEG